MKFNLFGRTFYFLADSNQQEKAMAMLKEYVFKPENLILFAILLIYIFAFIFAKIKNNVKLRNFLKKASPWMYFLAILGITILNRSAGEREIRLYHDVWFTETGFHESNVLGFALNMAMYIPFGFLLSKYYKIITAFITVVSSSFIIEALQYILARGVTATDDLAANIIGGIIGILFTVILQNFKKHKSE